MNAGTITDFCTGRQIDIQALMRMATYAEQASYVEMSNWFTPCGTHGCLVGTYALRENLSIRFSRNPDEELPVIEGTLPQLFAEYEFNITRTEVKFLFGIHPAFGWNWTDAWGHLRSASMLGKEQAIRRLRKFIYYKLHKSELLADYEKARRTEGNQDFVGKASRLEELVTV